MYEGDLITVTYTNNTDSAITVFPVDSNLSGVLTIGAPNCRWHNLAAHTTKQCTTATHTVTADDVAAGTFTPMTTWAATRDRNGTDVIAGGITANADPVTVAQGERPPAPDPLETPQDYAIGDKVRLASPGLAGFSCHRIPALTTATNGWIIAVWDGRPDTCQEPQPTPEPAPAVTPAHWVNTGWDLQDGKWSYYNAYGARVSGWVKDGSWYYLDPATGVMATGWVQVDGTWYLLSASGAILTGWPMIDGRWYYFASSGAWI